MRTSATAGLTGRPHTLRVLPAGTGCRRLVVCAGGALVFRAPASASMVVRVLGFATAPGVLIVPAAALSAALPPPAVLLPILLVRLFAGLLAIRVGMSLAWLRSIALLIVASAVGLAAVVAATRLLYEW